MQAKDDLQTVQLVASVVNNTQLNSTLSTTARDAVVSAYGGTQHNLQQAQGRDLHSPLLGLAARVDVTHWYIDTHQDSAVVCHVLQ